jgi:hypothetical protein
MTTFLLVASALLLVASAVCLAWIRAAAASERRHKWNFPG